MAVTEYKIGSFTDVADRWGDRLWRFLNERHSVRQMTDASDEGRPAAEAIALRLHQQFGDLVRQDRVKQFTGFLIRQVMEARGYPHTRRGAKTRRNPVFNRASVYGQRRG